MKHLSAQVKLVDLEALQVIVKSNWQHTSLDETMKSSHPEVYAIVSLSSQVLCRKHNIFMYLGEYSTKLLTFSEIKFGHKIYPHPLNPRVLA